MSKFTDAEGRDWSLCLSIADVKRVRTELEIDLLDVAGGRLYAQLLEDPVLIVDVLHVLLSEQCEKEGVDAVGFARGLRGDVLDQATQALMEGLIDFFPRRRRDVLRAAKEATDRWMERTAQHAIEVVRGPKITQVMDQQMQKLEQSIDEQLASLCGGPSPPGPPSSASIPDG